MKKEMIIIIVILLFLIGFTFTGYIAGGRIRGTGVVPILKAYFEEDK